MPKTYTFVLFEDDAKTFVGTAQYNIHDLGERLRKETDVLEPEFEMGMEEVRVLKILVSQFEQQDKVTGPVVEMSVMQSQAEDLHLALVQQLAFVKRQAFTAAKLLTVPDLEATTKELLQAEWNGYFHQSIVLADLIKQVGRSL